VSNQNFAKAIEDLRKGREKQGGEVTPWQSAIQNIRQKEREKQVIGGEPGSLSRAGYAAGALTAAAAGEVLVVPTQGLSGPVVEEVIKKTAEVGFWTGMAELAFGSTEETIELADRSANVIAKRAGDGGLASELNYGFTTALTGKVANVGRGLAMGLAPQTPVEAFFRGAQETSSPRLDTVATNIASAATQGALSVGQYVAFSAMGAPLASQVAFFAEGMGAGAREYDENFIQGRLKGQKPTDKYSLTGKYLSGVISGTIESLTETIGSKLITGIGAKTLGKISLGKGSPVWEFAKGAGKAYLTEAAEEALAETLQSQRGRITGEPTTGLGETARDAAIAGLYGGFGGLGGGAASLPFNAARMRAERNRLNESLRKSNTEYRDPEFWDRIAPTKMRAMAVMDQEQRAAEVEASRTAALQAATSFVQFRNQIGEKGRELEAAKAQARKLAKSKDETRRNEAQATVAQLQKEFDSGLSVLDVMASEAATAETAYLASVAFMARQSQPVQISIEESLQQNDATMSARELTEVDVKARAELERLGFDVIFYDDNNPDRQGYYDAGTPNTIFIRAGQSNLAEIVGIGYHEALHGIQMTDGALWSRLRQMSDEKGVLTAAINYFQEQTNPEDVVAREAINSVASPSTTPLSAEQAIAKRFGGALTVSEGTADDLRDGIETLFKTGQAPGLLGSVIARMGLRGRQAATAFRIRNEMLKAARRKAERSPTEFAGTIREAKMGAEARASLRAGVEAAAAGPAAAAAATGTVSPARARKSDIGHKREKATGRYVGAPDWVGGDPNKLKQLRAKLRKLVNEGSPGRFWYEQSSKAILQIANNDIDEAERIVGLIAIYSPNAKVSANTTMALTAYYQWKAGQEISASYGISDKKAEALLMRNEGWSGIKTNSFYQNLMVEIDPKRLDEGVATMDMWMALAFDYGDKALDQGPKYRFAEREIRRLADEMGWKAHQVQAAIWTAMKGRIDPIRDELKAEEIKRGIGRMVEKTDPKTKKVTKVYQIYPDRRYDHYKLAHKMGMEYGLKQEDVEASKYDFSDAIEERIAQMSWETTPSKDTGRSLPGIHTATLAEKQQYLQAVVAATTVNGRDAIADMLGLSPEYRIQGFSAWDSVIGAGMQSMYPVPLQGAGKTREIKPVAKGILDVIAAIRGFVYEQDAVPYHTPVFDDALKRHNGSQITTARPLTAAEMQLLYDNLIKQFGTTKLAPGYRLDGARVLNFEDNIGNADFQKGIKAVIGLLPSGFGGGRIEVISFRSEGEYISNDWTKDKNGEGYIQKIEAGRPDVLGRVNDLRAVVEQVNADFAQRFGWGSVASYRATIQPARSGVLAARRARGYGMEPATAGRLSPLAGAPRIDGATGPDPSIVAVAERYAAANGIDLRRQAVYADVDEDRGRRIAAAYEAMPNDPANPEVSEAYRELAKQTRAQYDALVRAGYEFYFFDEANDPYKSQPGGFGNPNNAVRDLRQNKRMAVYPSERGYGTGLTAADYVVAEQPLLVDTGLRWGFGSPDGPQRPVLVNDLFRAVHDAFGHSMEGAGFRARGEENAWQAHVRLFTGAAIGAMTSETRGQNSWLNYGPFGAKNQTAKVLDTVFAEQKIGLMPSWTWTEGRVPDAPSTTNPFVSEARTRTDTPEFKAWFKDSKVVTASGEPMVVYHGTDTLVDFDTFKTGVTNDYGSGIYFGTTADIASEYAGTQMGARIIPVYLSIKNPLVASKPTFYTDVAKALGMSRDQFMDAAMKASRTEGTTLEDFVTEQVTRAGYDGIRVTVSKPNDEFIIVFEPNQIKSIFNRGTFDISQANVSYARSRDETVPPAQFFSALREAVRSEKQVSGSSQTWSNWLRSMVNKGVIKAEEVFWSGIEQWLNLSPREISKRDLYEFLDKQGMRITTQHLVSPETRELNGADGVTVEFVNEDEGYYAAFQDGVMMTQSDGTPLISGQSAAEVIAEIREVMNLDVSPTSMQVARQEMTGYGPDVFPSQTLTQYPYRNYREHIMVIPQRRVDGGVTTGEQFQKQGWSVDIINWDPQTKKATFNIYSDNREYFHGHSNVDPIFDSEPSELDILNRYALQITGQQTFSPAEQFTGSHHEYATYKGQVVVHYRTTDRIIDGKRYLFIEELQSDWAEKGRARGFLKGTESEEREAVNRKWNKAHRLLDTPLNQQFYDAVDRLRDTIVESISKDLADQYQDEWESFRNNARNGIWNALSGFDNNWNALQKSVGKELDNLAEHAFRLQSANRYFVLPDLKAFFTPRETDIIRRYSRVQKSYSGRDEAMKKISERLPVGPWVKSTDAWVTLGLKQIIMQAVNEGYDGVAFINGTQSAIRNAARWWADSISYAPSRNDQGEIEPDKFDIVRMRNGEPATSKPEKMKLDRIALSIGPDVAQMIRDGIGARSADDPDAKIIGAPEGFTERMAGGGIWMDYYDKILRLNTQKLLRKLDGPELKTVTLKGAESTEQQVAFEITNALENKVRRGLTMFARARRQESLAFQMGRRSGQVAGMMRGRQQGIREGKTRQQVEELAKRRQTRAKFAERVERFEVQIERDAERIAGLQDRMREMREVALDMRIRDREAALDSARRAVLKAWFAGQAKGSREGFNQAKREMVDMRRDALAIIKMLPKSMRSNYLNAVTEMRTVAGISKVARRVVQDLATADALDVVNEIARMTKRVRKVGLRNETRDEINRLLDDARSMLVTGQKRLLPFTDTMDLRNRTAAAIDLVEQAVAYYESDRQEFRDSRDARSLEFDQDSEALATTLAGQRGLPRERLTGAAPRQTLLGTTLAGIGNLDIYTLMQRLEGSESGILGKIWSGLIAGKDAMIRQRRAIDARIDDALRAAGYDGYDGYAAEAAGLYGDATAQTVDVVIAGETRRITIDQMMQLAALDDETVAGLRDDADPERPSSPIVFATNRYDTPMYLTQGEHARIVASLTPAQVSLIRTLKNLLESEIQPTLFDVHFENVGRQPPRVENYFPRQRLGDEIAGELIDVNMQPGQVVTSMLQNAGMLQTRVASRAPLVIGGMMRTLDSHIDEALRVIHLSAPLRHAITVLRRRGVRSNIERILGRGANDAIRKLVMNGAGMSGRPAGDIAEAINSNISGALLTLNPKTWLRQLGGAFRLMTEFPVSDWAAGMARSASLSPSERSRQIAEVEGANGYFYERHRRSQVGLFANVLGDPRTGSERWSAAIAAVGRALRSAGHEAAGGQWLRAAGDVRQGVVAVSRIVRSVDSVLRAVDRQIMLVAYSAAQSRLGTASPEAAAKLAERAFRKTQNVSDPLDDTVFAANQKFSRGLGRFMFPFSSDPLKGFNQLRRAIGSSDYGDAAKTTAALAGNIALSAAVNPLWTAIAFGIATAMDGGDDDDAIEEILVAREGSGAVRRLASDAAGTAFGYVGLIASGVIDAAMASPLYAADTGEPLAIRAFGDLAVAMASGNFGDALATSMQMSGVPVVTPVQQVASTVSAVRPDRRKLIAQYRKMKEANRITPQQSRRLAQLLAEERLAKQAVTK